MTQPTFSPVSRSGEVRPTVATTTPEIGRIKKAGLLRHAPTTTGSGTNAPGEGFAMTLAQRECADLHIDGVDHHDLVVGIALVAAKRASLAGRGVAGQSAVLQEDLPAGIVDARSHVAPAIRNR